MAKVVPFKAVRPTRDKVNLVTSRSYITYTKRQLAQKLDSNPYSFVHIVNPEFGSEHKTKPNSIERFSKTKNKYDEFKRNGILKQDPDSHFYVYRQTTVTNTYTGIIALTSVEDYQKGIIKKHENILNSRQEVFKNYLKTCTIHAEPVLLSYPENKAMESIIAEIIQSRAENDFTTTDRVRHELWLVENNDDVNKIQQVFTEVPALYIADGHHRSASSALLAGEYPGNASYQYFMSYLVPFEQLSIHGYHRAVKDLNNKTVADFFEAIQKQFSIIPIENNQAFYPSQKGSIGMYIDHQWYELRFKKNVDAPFFDAQILSDYVFNDILAIKNVAKSKKIIYISGTEKPEKLERLVDTEKAKVAFTLFPIAISELAQISDQNGIVPPKSTWIEPKLRSGLTIYEY